MSGQELVDFKCTLIYIYRCPRSDVYRFLEKLGTLIVKIKLKRKT